MFLRNHLISLILPYFFFCDRTAQVIPFVLIDLRVNILHIDLLQLYVTKYTNKRLGTICESQRSSFWKLCERSPSDSTIYGSLWASSIHFCGHKCVLLKEMRQEKAASDPPVCSRRTRPSAALIFLTERYQQARQIEPAN